MRTLASASALLVVVASGCSGNDKTAPPPVDVIEIEMHLEKFDTAAGTFAEKAPPTNKRVAEAVVSKGKLYFIGGLKSTTSGAAPTQLVDFVEIYDPATNKWSIGAGWPNPRLAQAFELDGLICMIAGLKNGKEVADVECYHTDTNLWTKRKPFPAVAAQLNGVVVAGKLYALGSVTGPVSGRTAHVESYVYDPGPDTWTPLAPLPAACSPKAVATVDDAAYVLGCPQGEGGDPTKGPATRIHRYSLSGDTWSIFADAIPAEDWNAALVIDKEILLYSWQGYPSLYRVHALTSSLQTASPPPTPFKIKQATTSWTTSGAYYTLVLSEEGGTTAGGTAHVWKYDLKEDSWKRAGEHRQDPRSTSLSPVVIGEDVYLVGSYASAPVSIH